jgi:transcriptional regulator GlxA family with amidase domain
MAHRVVMVTFPDAQSLDIFGPLEVFARTARWLRDQGVSTEAAYEVELVAAEAGPVRLSNGLSVLAGRAYGQVASVDTLMVSGGVGYAAACADRALLDWLRERAAGAQRLASVCNGALILAAAGLLDGREASTHWAYCDRLAELAPTCRVEPDAIYVQSGNVFTSAGVTAGIDLALAMVESDWGKATALAVAQELVVYRKRPGGQAQFSRFLEAERRSDRFGELQLWILDHLAEDLSIPRLAQASGMSVRHFAREFAARTGASPGDYVARVRLEEARRRLESGEARLKDVARQCGFGDEQALRRAFQRKLGVRPSDYRERFGG